MHNITQNIISAANQVILGKDKQIRMALACILARGHLLIEDLPGMGKTTLAHTLAQVLGLKFSRVQFTSDLLPADILGVSVYDRNNSVFKFHPGPVFTNVLLADEVNRATPKTQSALLEVMEEAQVTIEGETRVLPQPFFVIATQNPTHHIGTFPLPESQLDRFLMRIELGYPDNASERNLLKNNGGRDHVADIKPCVDATGLMRFTTCGTRDSCVRCTTRLSTGHTNLYKKFSTLLIRSISACRLGIKTMRTGLGHDGWSRLCLARRCTSGIAGRCQAPSTVCKRHRWRW
jgi:MoxR-like ATPase